MAEELARRLKAPAFAGDWLFGALKPFGVLSNLELADSLELYHRLLWTLASRQLMLEQSALMDCIVDDARAAQWREQAGLLGGRCFIVQCVCGDEAVHRRRVEGRERGIPGWHEVGWDHVLRMRTQFPPLRSPDLEVDALNNLDDNVRAVLGLLER